MVCSRQWLPDPNLRKSPQKTIEHQVRAANKMSGLSDSIAVIVAISGAVTAVATIFIAIFTTVLACVARRQAGLVEGQMKLTEILERAYLNVEPYGIEIDTKKDVIGHAAIVNKGRVPAREVSLFIRLKWDADANLGSFDSAAITPTTQVLPVGVEMPAGTNSLSAAERANFESKNGFLYVWGRVTYKDGFEQRWLDFCHRYNCASPRNSEGGIDPKYGRYHHSHNDGN